MSKTKINDPGAHHAGSGALIRRFLPYLAKYKMTLFLDLFCAALTTLCDIVLPKIMSTITNAAMGVGITLTAGIVLRLAALYFVLRIIDDCEGTPELILIASGSEVALAVHAKETLAAEGQKVRVVSMPCMDLFEEQSEEYKESVLPKAVRKRVAIEALSDFGWGRYVGLDGAYVTMTGFGASGPAKQLFEHFGFTVENVVETARKLG